MWCVRSARCGFFPFEPRRSHVLQSGRQRPLFNLVVLAVYPLSPYPSDYSRPRGGTDDGRLSIIGGCRIDPVGTVVPCAWHQGAIAGYLADS